MVYSYLILIIFSSTDGLSHGRPRGHPSRTLAGAVDGLSREGRQGEESAVGG